MLAYVVWSARRCTLLLLSGLKGTSRFRMRWGGWTFFVAGGGMASVGKYPVRLRCMGVVARSLSDDGVAPMAFAGSNLRHGRISAVAW